MYESFAEAIMLAEVRAVRNTQPGLAMPKTDDINDAKDHKPTFKHSDLCTSLRALPLKRCAFKFDEDEDGSDSDECMPNLEAAEHSGCSFVSDDEEAMHDFHRGMD